MHRFVLPVVLVGVASGLAHAQSAPSSDGDEAGVTVNMDALLLPEPMPVPEIPPAKATLPIQRVVPLPRPKPEQPRLAIAKPVVVEAVAPSEAAAPAPTAPKPPKADLPVSIIENFPVELRGAASDPFPNAKPRDPTAGFALVGRIRFARDQSQLPPDALAPLDAVAESLQSATTRIRLAAYSGRSGDMSSQARRLSLDRARVVRDYLVSRGIAFERIDVMPFGGATTGVSDRVDVLAPPS